MTRVRLASPAYEADLNLVVSAADAGWTVVRARASRAGGVVTIMVTGLSGPSTPSRGVLSLPSWAHPAVPSGHRWTTQLGRTFTVTAGNVYIFSGSAAAVDDSLAVSYPA